MIKFGDKKKEGDVDKMDGEIQFKHILVLND
jgi:hypothetical protein